MSLVFLLRQRTLRAASWLGAVAVAAVLVACGDSEVVEPFQADRVVAFGDEFSAVLPDKRKYSVNDFTDSVVDCTKNPIWVQALAADFGKPLASCPGSSTTAVSLTYAVASAKVDNLRLQVDAHLAADAFGEKDLVTMFVGMHDILEQYALVATDGESTITERLRERGTALGAQVNRVATGGSPVLVVTVPDLGRTPWGAAEETANAGRVALLNRLTSTFNTAMRLEIINDGRMIGLVDAFDLFGAMLKFPGNYGLTNTATPACQSTVTVPDCTTATLIQDNGATVDPVRFLWADRQHFGPTGHRYIGVIAVARARNNPF